MFHRADLRPHEAIICAHLMCSQVAPAELSLPRCTFCFQVICWLMNFLFHHHTASVKYRMFFVSEGVAESYVLRHENSSLQEI